VACCSAPGEASVAYGEGEPERRRDADQRRAAHAHRADRLGDGGLVREDELATLVRQERLVEDHDVPVAG
jgi:hypothetical protein